jgi:hypothetical protein
MLSELSATDRAPEDTAFPVRQFQVGLIGEGARLALEGPTVSEEEWADWVGKSFLNLTRFAHAAVLRPIPPEASETLARQFDVGFQAGKQARARRHRAKSL